MEKVTKVLNRIGAFLRGRCVACDAKKPVLGECIFCRGFDRWN